MQSALPRCCSCFGCVNPPPHTSISAVHSFVSAYLRNPRSSLGEKNKRNQKKARLVSATLPIANYPNAPF